MKIIKKITVIASFLLVLFIISGGYALYFSNNTQNTTSTDINTTIENNYLNKSDLLINNDSVKDLVIESAAFILDSTYSEVVATHYIFLPPGFNTTGYVVSNTEYYSYYVKENYSTTDKYSQCAECGKYCPLGEVTTSLPEEYICHGHNDSSGSYVNDDDPWIMSYDEVMYTIEHGTIPESVHNRTNEYFGLDIPYEERDNYYGGGADSADFQIIYPTTFDAVEEVPQENNDDIGYVVDTNNAL